MPDPAPIPAPTAGVVVFDGEMVLMVSPGPASKHRPDVMGLPAGRLEPGESAVDGAIRECEEETGLILRVADLVELPDRYTAILDRRDGSTELMTWTVFACQRFEGELLATAEATPCWVHRSCLHDLTLQKNVVNAVTQAEHVLAQLPLSL